MRKTGKFSAVILAGMIFTSPVNAGVCEWAAAGVVAAGTMVASASTVAGTLGLAAGPHVSGAAIASSVGVGGTGFLAGTLGTISTSALAIVSAPAVIATAVGVAVVGGGTATYCYFSD